MHHLDIGNGWSAIHNGDFSGDIQLLSPNGGQFVAPYSLLEAVVGAKVRMDRISKIEQMSAKEIIEG